MTENTVCELAALVALRGVHLTYAVLSDRWCLGLQAMLLSLKQLLTIVCRSGDICGWGAHGAELHM